MKQFLKLHDVSASKLDVGPIGHLVFSYVTKTSSWEAEASWSLKNTIQSE